MCFLLAKLHAISVHCVHFNLFYFPIHKAWISNANISKGRLASVWVNKTEVNFMCNRCATHNASKIENNQSSINISPLSPKNLNRNPLVCLLPPVHFYWNCPMFLYIFMTILMSENILSMSIMYDRNVKKKDSKIINIF